MFILKWLAAILILAGISLLICISIWLFGDDPAFDLLEMQSSLHSSPESHPQHRNIIDCDMPNVYDICDEVNKPRILIIVHHKTGTHLFAEFFSVFQKYYQQKCNATLEMGLDQWMHWFPDGIGRLEHFKTHFDRYKTLIIIHSIRAPVEILLSAYNYHKSFSKEIEQTSHKYGSLNELHEAINQTSRGYGQKIYCYNHFLFNDKSPLKIDKSFHHNYTIKFVLNNIYNVSMGLLYEYQRFLCYDWPDITTAYQLLSQIQANFSDIHSNIDAKVSADMNQRLQKGKMDNKTIIVEQVSMEQFKENFNLTVLRILDAFGIRNKTDRSMLMNGFVRYDTNIVPEKQYVPLIAGHVTAGKYDKQEQINVLLGEDKERCRSLKNMTNLLDMTWKYSQYC